MKTMMAFCTAALLSLTAQAGEYADISIADLKAAIAAKKVTLVDVNGDDSYKEGHIPGAILFEGKDKLAKELPADKASLVVAYCGGPSCNAYRSAAKAAASGTVGPGTDSWMAQCTGETNRTGVSGWPSRMVSR